MKIEDASTVVALNPADLPNIPAFVSKLYTMVSSPDITEIQWTDDGVAFVIYDTDAFAKKVMPQFVKSSQFSSFTRQLNLYGFSRMEEWKFQHPLFRKNQPSLLTQISRRKNQLMDSESSDDEPKKKKKAKATKKETSLVPSSNLNVNTLLHDIATIKRSQFSISTDLQKMQKDNKQLWDECQDVRDQFAVQQETIQRLLGFLGTVFTQNRALEDIASTSDAKRRRSEEIDVANVQDRVYRLMHNKKPRGAKKEPVDLQTLSLNQTASPVVSTPLKTSDPVLSTSSLTVDIDGLGANVDSLSHRIGPTDQWAVDEFLLSQDVDAMLAEDRETLLSLMNANPLEMDDTWGTKKSSPEDSSSPRVASTPTSDTSNDQTSSSSGHGSNGRASSNSEETLNNAIHRKPSAAQIVSQIALSRNT